jgi:nucleoside-diphosphate-sugar epimerase
MTKMNFPKQFSQIVVDNFVYTPDKNGQIEVENSDHIPEIAALGGTVPDAVIHQAAVEAAIAASSPEDQAALANSVDGTEVPTEDMTRPNMIEWLRKNGIAISTASSKSEAWTAIQSFLEQGDG